MAKKKADIRTLSPDAQLRIYFQHEDLGPPSPPLSRDGGTTSLSPRPPQWNQELYQTWGDDAGVLMATVYERLQLVQQTWPLVFSILRSEYVVLAPLANMEAVRAQNKARARGAGAIALAKEAYAKACESIPFPARREKPLVEQTERFELAPLSTPPKGRKALLRWMSHQLMRPLHDAGYL